MKFTLLTLFLFASLIAEAQNQNNNDTTRASSVKIRKPVSVTFSLFNHAVSLPFNKMIHGPIHPGFRLGIEGRYYENDRSKIFQTLNMGVFYNRYNGTGIYSTTELAYRFTAHQIFAEALLGVGYVRVYHPVDIYTLGDDGTYHKITDKGFLSGLVNASVGVGYSFTSTSSLSFSPFIRYEILVQTKYNPDLTALPQTAFHVGVRVNKKRTK